MFKALARWILREEIKELEWYKTSYHELSEVMKKNGGHYWDLQGRLVTFEREYHEAIALVALREKELEVVRSLLHSKSK